MSLSPQRNKIIKQSQLSTLQQESPTKNDINFYIRKTNRLEQELGLLQNELSTAKLRLRKAEDFEIKYDLVTKQNNNLLSENQKIVKELTALRGQIENLNRNKTDVFNKNDDTSKQIRRLEKEIETWKHKYDKLDQEKETVTKYEVKTLQKSRNTELDNIKREFKDREERLEADVRQLKRILNQKASIESSITLKVQRIRNQKDAEISRLNAVITSNRIEFEQVLAEKREDIQKMQQKFQKMFEYEIQNIRLNQENQDQIFNIQLSGLKEVIALKNQEIQDLFDKIKSQNDLHDKQVSSLKQEIQALRDRIYKGERQNQIELNNVKERLTKIHADEILSLETKYKSYIDGFKKDSAEVENILKAKDQEIERERSESERLRNQCMGKVKEKQQIINDLKDKIKEVSDLHTLEMKTLHESFHHIESEKETMVTGYQENVTFLQQQIKSYVMNLQNRTNELKYLENELSFVKKSNTETVNSLDQKWKGERKERQLEREKFREQKQVLLQTLQRKEKEWRDREKTLEEENEKYLSEKSRLTFVVEQLEKDTGRLNRYIKEIDDNLKRELKKNQIANMDVNSVRREMLAELDRQKSQLQAIKRMEIDQITKKFQIQSSKISNNNQRLQTELLNKTLALEKLEEQYKKIEAMSKQLEKRSKDKILEYQRQMATLNSEIQLTQNLYQSFMDAKSRLKQS